MEDFVTSQERLYDLSFKYSIIYKFILKFFKLKYKEI